MRWAIPGQANSPAEANYITAYLGKKRVGVSVKHRTAQVTINLEERVPKTGQVLKVIFGDTCFGGPGFIIPAIAYDIDVVVEIDPEGDGSYRIAGTETMRYVGAHADTLSAIASPSIASPGDTLSLIVSAMQGTDGIFDNMYIVPEYHGTVKMASEDGTSYPNLRFTPDSSGIVHAKAVLRMPGVWRFLFSDSISGIAGVSNPILIRGSRSGVPRDAEDILRNKVPRWGVLQSHTAISGHAGQTPEYAYRYAQYVSNLDVVVLTEHCERYRFSWPQSIAYADAYYKPGAFVTFPGFEIASLIYGHRHLIYFNPRNKRRCPCTIAKSPTTYRVSSIDELLADVKGRNIIVIPHHTGWNYSRHVEGAGVQFGDPSSKNQILFEIFSQHGSSEVWQNDPYPIHDDRKKHQWPRDRKYFYRDVLARGYKFGITAGTDNHSGHVGGHSVAHGMKNRLYSRQGITAIYADSLTRSSVWAALKRRETYGTTGQRMIVAFEVSGGAMGSETEAALPVIKYAAIGTDIIDKVEIFRNGYDLIFASHPQEAARMVSGIITDTKVKRGREYSYYLRVTQRDNHIAWASPVWVKITSKGKSHH